MGKTIDSRTQFFSKFSEAEVRACFGPGSSSVHAAQVQRRDPTLYAQLKQASCYEFGIVPESALPLSSRLTKEQLETKYKADRAAYENEKIPLPDPIADRIGATRGMLVTYDQLRALMTKEKG